MILAWDLLVHWDGIVGKIIRKEHGRNCRYQTGVRSCLGIGIDTQTPFVQYAVGNSIAYNFYRFNISSLFPSIVFRTQRVEIILPPPTKKLTAILSFLSRGRRKQIDTGSGLGNKEECMLEFRILYLLNLPLIFNRINISLFVLLSHSSAPGMARSRRTPRKSRRSDSEETHSERPPKPLRNTQTAHRPAGRAPWRPPLHLRRGKNALLAATSPISQTGQKCERQDSGEQDAEGVFEKSPQPARKRRRLESSDPDFGLVEKRSFSAQKQLRHASSDISSGPDYETTPEQSQKSSKGQQSSSSEEFGDLPQPDLREFWQRWEYPSAELNCHWAFACELGKGGFGETYLWLKYDKETGVVDDVSYPTFSALFYTRLTRYHSMWF
jgi:hypothetical protein